MDSSKLSVVEELCYASIKAGVKRLCEIGTWPRPPKARWLRVGHDFYREQMEGIAELDDLINYLGSDAEIKSNYFMKGDEPKGWLLYDFWELLLLRILPETGGSAPGRGVFHKWFNKFVKELYAPMATWRTIQSIKGLKLNVKRLRFDEATVLISCPAYSLPACIWGPQQFLAEGHFQPEHWGATGADNAVLLITVQLPKSEYVGFDQPPLHLTKEFQRSLAVMDAIRLVTSGAPYLHCYANVHLSRFPLAEPLAYTHRDNAQMAYETEAQLGKAHLSRVRRIWSELMLTRYADPWPSFSKPRQLDVALSEFYRSYELQSWLDKVVDLTIALESLFGPRDDKELSHRISLRAAWLLSPMMRGSAGASENRIYKCVRTMYEIRSRRVHGDIPRDSEIHRWIQVLSGSEYDRHDRSAKERLLEQVVESARSIVRDAICACMELQKSAQAGGPCWPLPSDFDQKILLPHQRKVWQTTARIKTTQLRKH